MKRILLTQGKFALVDDEDFESVSQFKWYAWKNKTHRSFYVARSIRLPCGRKQLQYLHNFLLGRKGVDHHDGDGLNNRRKNLRAASHTQNGRGFRHKQVDASSNFRGVHWRSREGRWGASIRVNKVLKPLGIFTNETVAARAYDAAATTYFGSFATLNFPVKCRD